MESGPLGLAEHMGKQVSAPLILLCWPSRVYICTVAKACGATKATATIVPSQVTYAPCGVFLPLCQKPIA